MLLNTCNQVDFSILFMHSPVVHVNPRSFPAEAAADHVHPGFYPFPPLAAPFTGKGFIAGTLKSLKDRFFYREPVFCEAHGKYFF